MKFMDENFLRNVQLGFTIVFGILSTSLIAIGVIYIDELGWPKTYLGLDFAEFSTMIIVLGSLSLIMSIAGCFLTRVNNRALLFTFISVLTVILCLQLATAIISFMDIKKNKFRRLIRQ